MLFKRIISLFAVIVLMLAALPLTAENEPRIDLDRTGSITVTLRDSSDEHNAIPGAVFDLFFAAQAFEENSQLVFRYAEAFAGCGIDIDLTDAAPFAAALAAYAGEHGLPFVSAACDENGTVIFTDLTPGIYLIVEEGNVPGFYPVAPFVVAIPMTNEDGTGWLYDVEAVPKAEPEPAEPPAPVELTVSKLWQDDESGSRPLSVTIELLSDGEVVDTIVLSGANGWAHTWTDLDGSHSYTVREADVPDGYVVSYLYNEFSVVITNTSKIVQTGQLNWPVPVLLGAGVLMLVIGMILVLTNKKKNNKKNSKNKKDTDA